MKQFHFIEHALKELQRRSISMQVVLDALDNPDQVVPNVEGREAYHKLIEINDKRYLIRIIVENGDYRCHCLPHKQAQEILERRMNFEYDAEADILRMIFKDLQIEEGDEEQPGVIVDYDAAGNVVGVEVLDVSKRLVPLPTKVKSA